MSTVDIRTFDAPPFCEREALRYAGVKAPDEETLKLLYSCFREAESCLAYKVCFYELPLDLSGDVCDFGFFSVASEKLLKNLTGCRSVLLFASTVGVGIDRLIAKYSRVSPARALMFQAIGAERIEALCDTFCSTYSAEKHVGLKPRFSPGYGDLPLDIQRDIFALLDCPRKIGLSLNDSLLMSPSKSVTAFSGITDTNSANENDKCSLCENTGCTFRSIL